MAKEVLEMEVKSNIKGVTKDTQDWVKTLDNVNESLNIQNKVITDLEKDLIKLKAKQDAIPKGAWVAGMDKLNDKIRETSSELKLEKNALKDLKNQQKEATTEVKKFTSANKGSNKEVKDGIGNFKVMGVSLNGVKKGFSQVIPMAKAMFGTIRAGIMATGIGALVIGVMALIQSFKRSEAGQEKFQRIMAGIGAVTSQILDLFAELGTGIIDSFMNPIESLKNFGKTIQEFVMDKVELVIDGMGLMGSALSKLFSGDFSGALDDAGEGFVKINRGMNTVVILTEALVDGTKKLITATGDLINETSKEVDALIKVTTMRQRAHHIDRKLKVERAKANREINDIRLKAEDREKFNATERIALLRKAQAIEEGITAKEIKSKQILVDALKLEQEQGLNNKATKDELAQLQADLINLDTKKLRSQRLLQTQITTAVNEERAIKEQVIKDEDAAWAKKIADNDKWNKKQISDAQKVADAKQLIAEKLEDTKQKTFQVASDAIVSIAGEGSAIGKAAAAAMAIINTKQAVTAALGAVPYGPWNIAQAVATGVFGMAQVRDILSTKIPGGGGGGGGAGASVGASPQTPAPQMMSGAFELTGAQAPEPVQAYVVSDDITNNQNKLATIRRRATI
tara:strand:+ start:1446 stop:3326 length:1881 start_codon:yes stop_codon:yes gene_type:complete